MFVSTLVVWYSDKSLCAFQTYPLLAPIYRIFGTANFQGEINFGANITVLERPRIAACSNCDGEYSLEGLIAGTYTIQVTGLPLGTVITETISVGSGDVEHDFDGSLSSYSY